MMFKSVLAHHFSQSYPFSAHQLVQKIIRYRPTNSGKFKSLNGTFDLCRKRKLCSKKSFIYLIYWFSYSLFFIYFNREKRIINTIICMVIFHCAGHWALFSCVSWAVMQNKFANWNPSNMVNNNYDWQEIRF